MRSNATYAIAWIGAAALAAVVGVQLLGAIAAGFCLMLVVMYFDSRRLHQLRRCAGAAPTSPRRVRRRAHRNAMRGAWRAMIGGKNGPV